MAKDVDAAFVERAQEKGIPVINVLSASAFEQKHIPGSLNAPVEGPGFEEAVERFAPDKIKPVVVHCSGFTCPASVKAGHRLEAMGYREVYEYRGGLEDWERQGKALEPQSASRPARPARTQERDRVSKEERVPPPF
ncbi:MAG: rhodanese-like domain-containing protein [Thermoplasmatota archaeon]